MLVPAPKLINVGILMMKVENVVPSFIEVAEAISTDLIHLMNVLELVKNICHIILIVSLSLMLKHKTYRTQFHVHVALSFIVVIIIFMNETRRNLKYDLL